jgi:hypothetical protein
MKIYLSLLVMAFLLSGHSQSFQVCAAEEEETLTWNLSIDSVEHTSVTFTISNVEQAQEAYVEVVRDSNEERVFEGSFSIQSASQKITVELTNSYLPTGYYTIYVKNKAGRRTSGSWCYVEDHSGEFSLSGEAYVNCFIGKSYGQYFRENRSKMTVTALVGFQEYSGTIDSEGKVRITYPQQSKGSILQVKVCDVYGCEWTGNYTLESCNLYDCTYDIQAYQSQATGTVKGNDLGQLPTKVQTTVGGKTYTGTVAANGTFSISYPAQTDGTELTFLFMDDHGCSIEKGETVDVTEYDVTFHARTGSASGYIYAYDYSFDYDIQKQVSITSAYVEINGKRYTCQVRKASVSEIPWGEDDDYEEDVAVCYYFSGTYPMQKLGTVVTLHYTDSNQTTGSKQVTLKNIPPKIKLDKVNTSTTKISGTTTAKAKVVLQVGKKKYTCKANAKGKFSKKIKRQKKGTKISVSVSTAEGYTNTCQTKVTQAKGTLFIRSYVYRTSETVSMRLTNAKKGDKVKVVVGSNTYVRKITSNKKTQNINVKIKKAAAGTSVKAVLYDNFGSKKDSEKSMVYYGDEIYVGMSAKDALVTTWGSPVQKNDYGIFLQWIFESGNRTLYVYIQNGKVTSMQVMNY